MQKSLGRRLFSCAGVLDLSGLVGAGARRRLPVLLQVLDGLLQKPDGAGMVALVLGLSAGHQKFHGGVQCGGNLHRLLRIGKPVAVYPGLQGGVAHVNPCSQLPLGEALVL